MPDVGCAKSVLVGEHEEPGSEKGSAAPLRHEGETVGMAVRTRTDVRPVNVSVGHRIDLAGAVELVLGASPRYRVPEPVRRADRLVGDLRRGRQLPSRSSSRG
ncbi:MAG: endonuclease V [Gemmatimonadota bacterium]